MINIYSMRLKKLEDYFININEKNVLLNNYMNFYMLKELIVWIK